MLFCARFCRTAPITRIHTYIVYSTYRTLVSTFQETKFLSTPPAPLLSPVNKYQALWDQTLCLYRYEELSKSEESVKILIANDAIYANMFCYQRVLLSVSQGLFV